MKQKNILLIVLSLVLILSSNVLGDSRHANASYHGSDDFDHYEDVRFYVGNVNWINLNVSALIDGPVAEVWSSAEIWDLDTQSQIVSVTIWQFWFSGRLNPDDHVYYGSEGGNRNYMVVADVYVEAEGRVYDVDCHAGIMWSPN